MSYKHFSLEERYYIEIELRKGTSVNSIAKALDRPQALYPKRLTETVERKVIGISRHIGWHNSDILLKSNRTSLPWMHVTR